MISYGLTGAVYCIRINDATSDLGANDSRPRTFANLQMLNWVNGAVPAAPLPIMILSTAIMTPTPM